MSTALPLRFAYRFGVEHGLKSEVNEIRKKVIQWDRRRTTPVRKGYIVDLFEKRGIFDEFKGTYWPFGNSGPGENKRLGYLQWKQEYEDFLGGVEVEEEQVEREQEFAAEADLRDFLAKNPDCIEQGLRVYQHSDGRSGIEFHFLGGFIDILAVDRDQRFVVIELKVGRGRNKVIGQLVYYMGWVDKNLGNGPCRGMIIAKEISDDLVLAVQRVPGVSLFRYKLSVSVEVVLPLSSSELDQATVG